MVEAQPMRLVIRCAAAAAVGASVVLLWLAVLPLLPTSWLKLPCDPLKPAQCAVEGGAAGPGVLLAGLALLVVALGWWLLGLLRVTGSALIGLLGPVLVFLLARIGAIFGYTAELPSIGMAVLAALAYLLAALLTEKTLPWLFRAIAAGVVVAGAVLGG